MGGWIWDGRTVSCKRGFPHGHQGSGLLSGGHAPTRDDDIIHVSLTFPSVATGRLFLRQALCFSHLLSASSSQDSCAPGVRGHPPSGTGLFPGGKTSGTALGGVLRAVGIGSPRSSAVAAGAPRGCDRSPSSSPGSLPGVVYVHGALRFRSNFLFELHRSLRRAGRKWAFSPVSRARRSPGEAGRVRALGSGGPRFSPHLRRVSVWGMTTPRFHNCREGKTRHMPGSSVSRWWHTSHGAGMTVPTPVLRPDLHSSLLGLASSGTECFPDALTLGLAVCLSVASDIGPGARWPAPDRRPKRPCVALPPVQSELFLWGLLPFQPRTPELTTPSLPGTQWSPPAQLSPPTCRCVGMSDAENHRVRGCFVMQHRVAITNQYTSNPVGLPRFPSANPHTKNQTPSLLERTPVCFPPKPSLGPPI